MGPVEFAQHPWGLRLKLWPSQKLLLKLVYGCSLSHKEYKRLEKWKKLALELHLPAYEVGSQLMGVRELALCLGMRSSKTFFGGIIGCYETYKYLMMIDPWSHYNILEHSSVFGIIAAASKDQARDTVFAQIRNFASRCQIFNMFGMEQKQYDIVFPSHHFTIRVGASNSSTIVGRTDLFIIFDELVRCPDTKGRMGGKEVYAGLVAGTKTLDGLKVSMSSPLYEDDGIMTLVRDAENIDSMLGLRMATWNFHKHLTRDDFASDFKKDRLTAMRDFGAQPSSAIRPFFANVDIIDRNVKHSNPVDELDRLTDEWKPVSGAIYIGAADAAVTQDSMGVGLAHIDGAGDLKVDFVVAFRPPEEGVEISSTEVNDFIMRIHTLTKPDVWRFDNWMYTELQQRLEEDSVVKHEHVLLKQYLILKALLNEDRIDLPKHKLLISELKGLELLKNKRVDHRRGFSKDLSDVVCQLAVEYDTIDEPDHELPSAR